MGRCGDRDPTAAAWPRSWCESTPPRWSAWLGEDVRLRGEQVIGSRPEPEGELLQLSAFTSEDGGPPRVRTDREAQPGAFDRYPPVTWRTYR